MMNEIVDLTTEEEEDSNIFPSYIKSEATTTVYVDLTMSPSPSPSPKKRKENKITSYFPISPSKKSKQNVIYTIEDSPPSPEINVPEGVTTMDTPEAESSLAMQFLTAVKNFATTPSTRDSCDFTTASSSSALRPSADISHALTFHEDCVYTQTITPSSSATNTLKFAQSPVNASSPEKMRSPSTSRSPHTKPASPEFDSTCKMLFNCRNSSKNVLQHDLHVSSSGLAANIMFQSDLQDVQHSTAALYEVQRTEEQAQQTTRQPPSQQQRSDNTLMVVAEEEAGEAGETPKYGALIAQHLRTMTAVTGQYMTLLYSIQQTAFSSHQLHAAAASSFAPSSALAASGGAGSMGSSSAERSAAASKSVKDSGRLKKRVELLEGLFFLREYSEETSLDCANMDIATLQAKAVLRESPNSRGMLKMINRALKESSLRVYLLLIECKCAVLKEKLAGRESVRGPNAAAAFDIFGLGACDTLEKILRRIFHLQSSDSDSYDGIAAAAASSSSSSAVTSKSAQRKAAQEKVNSVLAGDSSSSSSSASATAGASKVRTANDAKRAIAEVESSECALGMRILSVWCDYIRNIRLAAATPAGSSGTAVTEEEEEMVQDVLQMMFDLASELKGLKTADPIMGAPKSKGKAPETTQERDARQTADLLTELCAELFATTHSNADISDASQVTPHRSRGHGCDRIMQNVLSLEVVLLPFEDWRVEQQNKRKPASSSSASPPPAAVYLQGLLKNFQKECESVLGSWHTLSIGESTLCFLMAQLGALLHRVTQCLGSVQDELSVVTDDLSTGSADVYDVLAPLEDSTALQRIHAHVHRLCQSLLTKLRVTLYPMTHSSKVMNALLNDCSAEAKSSRPVCTSEEGGEGGELEEDQVNSKSGGKGEAAVLRDEYDHLLRTVSAELRRLHNESGGRESGASCGSNSSAGSASRARSSVDEALLELVLDLSIKG